MSAVSVVVLCCCDVQCCREFEGLMCFCVVALVLSCWSVVVVFVMFVCVVSCCCVAPVCDVVWRCCVCGLVFVCVLSFVMLLLFVFVILSSLGVVCWLLLCYCF